MIPRAASRLAFQQLSFQGLRVRSRGSIRHPRTRSEFRPAYASRQALQHPRWYASASSGNSEADAAIEEIQDLYATAKDEFEIAAEETEKKSVYGAEDREAAKEELQKLKDFYEKAVKESSPEVGAEIQRRVGQRIRELDNAVTAMEESAMED